MLRAVCSGCGSTFEWSSEFYAQKGLAVPPLRCPTCADARLGKDDHHTVKARKALHVFDCVDVYQAIQSLAWTYVEEQGGQSIKPYRRAMVRGRQFGASWSGRIDVFDQRSDPASHLARVRVMRTEHKAGRAETGYRVTGPCYPWYSKTAYEWRNSSTWEYVVLDDAVGGVPECRLVFAYAIQKWNRSDSVRGNPLWRRDCSGQSRSGMHSGQAVLAVVDEEHPLFERRVQDRGALHAGDRWTLARGNGLEIAAMLARKAGKPVEIAEVEYDGVG